MGIAVLAGIIIAIIIAWANSADKKEKKQEYLEHVYEVMKQVHTFHLKHGFDADSQDVYYGLPFILLDDKSKQIMCSPIGDEAYLIPYSKLLGYKLCENGHVREESDAFSGAVTGALIGNMIDKKYTSAGAIIGASGAGKEYIPVSDGVELLLQIEDTKEPLITMTFVKEDTDKDTEVYKQGLKDARKAEALLAVVMKQNRKGGLPDGEIHKWTFDPNNHENPEDWDENDVKQFRRALGLGENED